MTMAAARDVVHALADAGLTVATGESLTAGLLAARLADVPGASAVLHGGVVAYQNAVKTGLLGVPEDLLTRVGAVDADVARRMALGARAALGADVGVATTGVAGPEPHQGRPVGVRIDKQGALLVADDVGNTIWRVTPSTQSAAR